MLVFFVFAQTAKAQECFPYWNEVQSLKKLDSTRFPVPNQILFVGSSSFTLLRDTANIFPGYKILNRAFGGSTLEDVIRYRYDVIFPYQPKQIVLYCGENDFAYSDTVSVQTVTDRFKTLYHFIRTKYPLVPFIYISIKPSPSRAHLMDKFVQANKAIAIFLKPQPAVRFIDVYKQMLDQNGAPRPELFREDQLHMNPKGYAIWKKMIQPYLVK